MTIFVFSICNISWRRGKREQAFTFRRKTDGHLIIGDHRNPPNSGHRVVFCLIQGTVWSRINEKCISMLIISSSHFHYHHYIHHLLIIIFIHLTSNVQVHHLVSHGKTQAVWSHITDMLWSLIASLTIKKHCHAACQEIEYWSNSSRVPGANCSIHNPSL